MDDESSKQGCELGPLPIADGNSELQEKSMKALHALFMTTGEFVLRDERVNDMGVDCSLEVRLSGFMTNFRAQVQVKASAEIKVLKDGCASLSIKTSNLNYLLNGVAPIYIFYDAQGDQFWYAWARDEASRLEGSTPNWRDQTWVSIRFTKMLSENSFKEVRERIVSEGKMYRAVRDSLVRSAGRDSVVVRIDPESLKTTDRTQAHDLLLTTGAAIVAAGFPEEVLALLNLIEPSGRSLPRLQFVEAYALFTKGEHYMALGFIRRALARRTQLSAQEVSFAETLRDSAEHRLGIIDEHTYQNRLAARSEALSGLGALEARQDLLYHRCLGEKDNDARVALLAEFSAATDAVLNHPDATRGVKLDARIGLLYAEGMQANLLATQSLITASIRGQLFPGDLRGVVNALRAARSSRSDWEEKGDAALREAYDLGQPVLIARALTVVLNVRIGRLVDAYMEAVSRGGEYAVGVAARGAIDQTFEEAEKTVRLVGITEARLILQKLRADYLALQGDLDSARQLAEETYAEALAMGLATTAEGSLEIIENRTSWLRFKREFDITRSKPHDWGLAYSNDDELKRQVRQLLEIVGSPPAHPQKVYGHLRSLRLVAQERYSWCRHLQILEDLTMTTNPSIAFSRTPPRKCYCDLFSHESVIATVDVPFLLDDFKRQYCSGCTERRPKARLSDEAV